MIKFNADEIKEIVTSNWEKKEAKQAAEIQALAKEISESANVKNADKIDKIDKIDENNNTFNFAMLWEWIINLFSSGNDTSGNDKSINKLKNESDNENLLENESDNEESFTDLPKKNKNLLMLVVVIIAFFIIYKILSNKHVQTGIGYGVGNVAGEAIGEGLYRNSGAITRAGSGLLNTIGEVGSNAIEELL
jgi:hypothetical protein